MQQRQDRVVGAWAEIRAEHGVERQRALQQRRLEGLLEHVEDVDAGDAQELPHRIAAQPADVEAQHRRGDELRAAAAADPRRAPVVLLPEHARKAQHAVVVFGERRPVLAPAAAPASSSPPCSTRWSPSAASATVRRFACAVFRPWAPELELAADAGIELIANMRAGGDAESRRELPRDRRAADPVRGLEHQHLAAGPGEVGGAHQAVVAGADDDDAVAVSHRASPRARDWAGAGRAVSRARRWRPVPP